MQANASLVELLGSSRSVKIHQTTKLNTMQIFPTCYFIFYATCKYRKSH